MSALGELNKKKYILSSILTEGSVFPYDLIGKNIIGISISNDTVTEISITITDINDTASTVRLSADKNFESLTKELKTINTNAVTNFSIALFEEG